MQVHDHRDEQPVDTQSADQGGDERDDQPREAVVMDLRAAESAVRERPLRRWRARHRRVEDALHQRFTVEREGGGQREQDGAPDPDQRQSCTGDHGGQGEGDEVVRPARADRVTQHEQHGEGDEVDAEEGVPRSTATATTGSAASTTAAMNSRALTGTGPCDSVGLRGRTAEGGTGIGSSGVLRRLPPPHGGVLEEMLDSGHELVHGVVLIPLDSCHEHR